jgi:hypothetical protein
LSLAFVATVYRPRGTVYRPQKAVYRPRGTVYRPQKAVYRPQNTSQHADINSRFGT